MVTDTALVPAALYAAFALRFDTVTPVVQLAGMAALFALLTACAPVVFTAVRLPWVKVGTLDQSGLIRLGSAAAARGTLSYGLAWVLDVALARSIPIIFTAVFFLTALTGRTVVQSLTRRRRKRGKAEPVAIYGAGVAGQQLAAALSQSQEVRPVVFVDDNRTTHGVLIAGLRVIAPGELRAMVADGRVARVLVALPSLSPAQLERRIETLADLSCPVQVMPTYDSLVTAPTKRHPPVDADQILGQAPLSLSGPMVEAAYRGRCVLVTGAGGVIGSEICAEVLACGPDRLILFDQSETALFALERRIAAAAQAHGVAVVSRLGSITHADGLAALMRQEGVDVILHAASHKNPAIVAQNVAETARINVLGTQILTQAAVAAGVARLVVVSTARPPLPQDVGATLARLAEHVALDIATRHDATRISVLRLDHVSGTAGAILDLLTAQIRAGGPIRLPHPEATRLFLGRAQAARLVILAAAHNDSGTALVTDAVAPVRLTDIAERLIEATGAGDIPITYSGLRPGEPLHEARTSATDAVKGTSLPHLLNVDMAGLSEIQVAAILQELRGAIAEGDAPRGTACLNGGLRDAKRLKTGTDHG